MISPFNARTDFYRQLETFLGNGDVMGLATLTLNAGRLIVPCTHTEIAGGLDLMPGGFSPKTFVEKCEVRAVLLGDYVPKQYHKCQLTVRPGAVPIKLQLWSITTEQGGEIYRFALADESYKV
jgi:hypothetical protein